MLIRGFLSGSDSEESACSAGDLGWTQSLAPEDPLEEEVATRSSIGTWGIPWTGKPGGLQTMGLQKSQIQLSD